jgi:hypothetical protein
MRFGVAKDIITPIEPTMLVCTGVYKETYKEIHDDMFVRCIVMDDGEKKAVIFSYDLIFHDRTLNDKIAAYAAEKHGQGLPDASQAPRLCDHDVGREGAPHRG